MAARSGQRRRRRDGTPSVLLRVAEEVAAKVDVEAEARGLACGLLADHLLELGLRTLRAQEKRERASAAASTNPIQESLMAI